MDEAKHCPTEPGRYWILLWHKFYGGSQRKPYPVKMIAEVKPPDTSWPEPPLWFSYQYPRPVHTRAVILWGPRIEEWTPPVDLKALTYRPDTSTAIKS
jgi:hypothetical protein